MSSPRYARLATKVLSGQESARVVPPSPLNRAAATAAIEAALRKRRRRRALSRWTMGAAVTIGAAAAGFVLWRRPPPAPSSAVVGATTAAVTVVGHPAGGGGSVVNAASRAPIDEGKTIGAGSRVVAQPNGRVMLALSTGTRMIVEEGGDVAVVDQGPKQVFAIRAGALRADVAKLEEGQRFIIQTPDAEVEVHGTSFRVAVVPGDPACADGTSTRLDVYEGVVALRHEGVETKVRAHERWPADCRQSAPAAETTARAVVRAASPAATGKASAATTEASTLAEQNDRFAQAIAAKRSGRAREAVEQLDAFLAQYPASPLCESAMAERMKLLRTVDPRRAQSAAHQYLASYPKGFARGDANAILAEGP